MSFFTVSNLRVGYGSQNVLQDLSVSVESGCVMGILGANGSGKTTLLKGICGILPHGGSCTLDGTALEGLSARKLAQLCSYIPQRSGIAIDISALDVVLMGYNPRLGLLEQPNTAMREEARRMLARVGLAGREEENYLHLSEGQKQLCILARTLVTDSKLLLLDEPESALDFRFRYQMLAVIKEWALQKRRAALVALHDPMLALNACDKLLLLQDDGTTETLCPKSDSLETMEQKLSQIYGPVSLTYCKDRQGSKHLIMLNEQEDSEWKL